ncbi:MAG: hypothetical protein IJY15_09330 [Thermoguttaceae bacterium]|nr:hypothetical protein [Thermoguttaceae bacterium]
MNFIRFSFPKKRDLPPSAPPIPMNTFDRFSRRYSSPAESPFRRDALPSDRPDDAFPARRAAVVSSPSTRVVYRLSRTAAGDDSCVSVADVSFPTSVESPRSLPASSRSTARVDFSPSPASPTLGLTGLTSPQIERLAFLETLVACNGCRRLAARKLGVSEKTMYNKIKQYKLSAELERLASRAPQEPSFN